MASLSLIGCSRIAASAAQSGLRTAVANQSLGSFQAAAVAPLRASTFSAQDVRPTWSLVRAFHRSHVVCAEYARKEKGDFESLEYRVFYQDNSGETLSPWHDIPLRAGEGLFNMVCEIPKDTSAKMEVATDEPNTPIKQDIKKGKLRYYPYNIHWNYGLLPQTWEDPSHANPEVDNTIGDNDPVDVVEIGEKQSVLGEVYPVKPLGVLAMIDEGELDWKVVCIRADDPKAHLVNDVDDVEREFPGTLTAIRDWFRDYKIPDGKPPNKFGLGEKAADKAYALKVIEETNHFWEKLVKRVTPRNGLSLS
eukprot:TRINITY_DN4785_c0_g1_i2.p1 TRINITY_DN4785_c0_g1~~TRINITY_DN4785_c0_g1_i2.p1  ORF type:complete len:307 (-),score=17.14 TRINITY_DN4785_c0_g1_i2:81-1001(-)